MLVAHNASGQDEIISNLRKHINTLARKAPKINEQTLKQIRTVDKKLGCNSQVYSVCIKAANQIADFLREVDGVTFQQAARETDEAITTLETLRKKHFNSGFENIGSVTIEE
jgi:hypothetical protein